MFSSQLRIPFLVLIFGMVGSSCVITDLRNDLDIVRNDYGYFKGRVTSTDNASNILVALLKDDAGEHVIANMRTVQSGEVFYALVTDSDYTVLAFSDTNGDLLYQPGEPAAIVNDPLINWFSEVGNRERVDPQELATQDIRLSPLTRLEKELDFSLAALQIESRVAQNFLRIVTWEDEAFSDASIELGMWQPSVFQEQVGTGLYTLEAFEAGRKIVVLVHGINDSPRVFQSLVAAVPDDYEILLFHYPGAVSLEYSSYSLEQLLGELIARFDVPRIDVIAHSMGGLVSKGMIAQADASLRARLGVFVSISSPFGGHDAATAGIRWAPVVAPVWWAMAPGSSYLQEIAGLDLSRGPDHHLIYSYSHERGGTREEDDGVVTVESQLVESSASRAVATYGIADSHVGIISNACTLALVSQILRDADSLSVSLECTGESDISLSTLR